MAFELPSLPYALNALEPYISAETLNYHYGKHHLAYVNNLNNLLKDEPTLSTLSLEKLISSSTGAIFNNAAQVWNHTFYFNCLSPQGGGDPKGNLEKLILRDFGSVEQFKTKFTEVALKTFGSGWAWLVLTAEGKLDIISTSNAMTPLTSTNKPLLTCDVWEHAYYIDYRNLRPDYLKAFWNLVNWTFVEHNLA